MPSNSPHALYYNCLNKFSSIKSCHNLLNEYRITVRFLFKKENLKNNNVALSMKRDDKKQ